MLFPQNVPWLRASLQPIGIDLTGDCVHALQLKRAGAGRMSVIAASQRSVIVSQDASVADQLAAGADAIAQVMKVGAFTRRAAAVTLPDSIVHIRTLRVSAAAAEAAMQFPARLPELRSALPFDPSEAALRVVPTGLGRHGGTATDVIVAASRLTDVEMWLKCLRDVGLHVDTLQIRPFALYAGYIQSNDSRSNDIVSAGSMTKALLEINASHSMLIVGDGHQVKLLKRINVGTAQLDDAIARKVSVTPDEARRLRQRQSPAMPADAPDTRRDPVAQAIFDAIRAGLEELAADVAMCLRYHAIAFRGPSAKELVLYGAGASDALLRETLLSALSVPVRTAGPLASRASRIDTSNMKPADSAGGYADWAIPIALSAGHASARNSQLAAA